jgi:XapX domain-containing protein
MKVYVLSLGAGLLVGVIYNLLNVRSPAPPLVALVGLLGILVGEQIIPVGKLLLGGSSFSEAFHLSSCDSHSSACSRAGTQTCALMASEIRRSRHE